MNKIKVYHVDAFTSQAFGGNPAGVVPEAEGLTDFEMQQIARELNLSETVFMIPPADDNSDGRVRYFTPSEEINFCGHATVALAWIMALHYGFLKKKSGIRLETNIGIIPVAWDIKEGGLNSVVMTQLAPQVKAIEVQLEEICRLVGIQTEDLEEKFPIRLAYTGNWHLLVPVKSARAIDCAVPLLGELAAFNREHDVCTTHLFTFDSFDPAYKLYTRDFAPAIGIAEDPVTGSANGTLAGYLVLEGIIDPTSNHAFKIAQGHAIGRPGEVFVNIIQGDYTPSIKIGGQAVVTISGMIHL